MRINKDDSSYTRHIQDIGQDYIEDNMETKAIMGKEPLLKHLREISHTFTQQRSKPK
jgi:hypothetical protein